MQISSLQPVEWLTDMSAPGSWGGSHIQLACRPAHGVTYRQDVHGMNAFQKCGWSLLLKKSAGAWRGWLSGISPQDLKKLIFFSRDLTIHFSLLTRLNLESYLQAWATMKLRDVKAAQSPETWWWEDSRRNEWRRELWVSTVSGFLLSKSLSIPPFLLVLPKHSYLVLVPLEQQCSQELWNGWNAFWGAYSRLQPALSWCRTRANRVL